MSVRIGIVLNNLPTRVDPKKGQVHQNLEEVYQEDRSINMKNTLLSSDVSVHKVLCFTFTSREFRTRVPDCIVVKPTQNKRFRQFLG